MVEEEAEIIEDENKMGKWLQARNAIIDKITAYKVVAAIVVPTLLFLIYWHEGFREVVIEIVSYPPFVTVIGGIILSYLAVHQHERSKDKIKIKENIVMEVIHSQQLFAVRMGIYQQSPTEDYNVKMNELGNQSNKHEDTVLGLIRIYSEKVSDIKIIEELFNEILEITNPIHETVAVIDGPPMISRDIYLKDLNEGYIKYFKILDVIRDMKIVYKI